FVLEMKVQTMQVLFTRRSTIIGVLITTTMGISMSIPSLTTCCRVVWLFDEWTSTYWPQNSWYIQLDFVITLTTIGVIVFCYVGVCWRVRQRKAVNNATGRKDRSELRIALQVGIMCTIYILNSVLWNIVPYLGASKAIYCSNKFEKSFIQIHPTIAFAFNGRIRSELLAK
ncbi:hypothetical protein PMAYCL1PPCAC_20278, partial [Pristionchus mayeri]